MTDRTRDIAIERLTDLLVGVWDKFAVRVNEDAEKHGFYLRQAIQQTADVARKLYDHANPEPAQPAATPRSK